MIYVICGPTGSGKTDLANIIAEKLDAPIINADAFQIYKDMNIGTNKITSGDKNYKRYYLLDVVSPEETFSVREYQKLFRETIDKLLLKYENIVICGGTGLYIKASLYDYVFEEFHDDVSDLENLSNEEIYQILKEVDPESAKTIHINNRKRVIRAISIARNAAYTKSETIKMQEHNLIYKNVVFLMLDPDRTELYERINERVDYMFKVGLVEEVKNLLERYSLSKTAKQAIGYKEIINFINGEIDIKECMELVKKRTRNYAKRQWTFFNNQFPVKKFKNKCDLIKEVFGQ